VSRARKIWLLVGTLLGLGVLGMTAAVRWTSRGSEVSDIPIARVKRGDLDPRIYATGELKATHSSVLSAPQIGGGSLQITHLLHTGVPVKKGDIVIEFDPTEQQFKLEQNRSDLQQADQEIIKAKADASVQAATDRVALLKARFEVRRAELEVEKNELASAIDAKKNELSLEQARRALAQLEQDIQSHAVSEQATIELALEKRHKATLAMDQAKQNIEKMKVHAPMDGLIAIERNTDSEGDFFGGGMSVPDYREGDQTSPGAAVARILDPADMEVSAKLNERERNNVKVGQAAEIELDALRGQTFAGTVKAIGGMAARNFWEGEQGGHFELTVQVPGSDPRLRAGFTVRLVIAGEVRKDVLYVPRQAVFMRDSKRVVYVKEGSAFSAREVKVVAETESRAAIEGVTAGAEIALVNPTLPRKSSAVSSTQPSLGGGPR
jgi:multidrug efflux pump subunit AcrA (membrane-fusion protein)